MRYPENGGLKDDGQKTKAAGDKGKPGNPATAKVGEHYQVNADAVLAYLLKGADAATGAALDLPRWGEGGPIIGKRAGWTENIGQSARARAKI